MPRNHIVDWQPRVMRHGTETGYEEFAIHEVYFGEDRQIISYTEDALSPRKASVAQLQAALLRLVEQEDDEVIAGDLNYIYSKEDIQEWLRFVAYPPIEYQLNVETSDERLQQNIYD